MIEKLILEALQTAAIAAYDASSISAQSGWTKPTRIKVVSRTLLPPADGKYLEFINIPNDRNGDYWGDERIYQGNFRIILHWNIDDAGPYQPLIFVDEIASFFPKGKTFANGAAAVKIYGVPLASGPIENGSELLFPLALPYRCFVQ